MGCTVQKCCGFCCVWTTAVFIVLAMVIPWYSFATTYTINTGSSSTNCATGTFFFWANVLCRDSAEPICRFNCDVVSPPFSPENGFWGADGFTHVTKTFAASFFLLFISMLLFLGVALYISVKSCCSSSKSLPSKQGLLIAGGLLALGTVLFAICIVVFAATLPKAIREDVGRTPGDWGPWETFFGTHHKDLNDQTWAWAAPGWLVAILAWPFYFGVTLFLLASAFRSHRSGYALVN
ncbi:hypothetical protein QOT17_000838 [Balamuthia mandrillaris]